MSTAPKHTDPPRAEVCSTRPNQSRTGYLVARVRCPYAAQHVWKGAGHEYHYHGVPPDLEAGTLRHPHCDSIRTIGELPQYLVVMAPRPDAGSSS